MHLFFFFFFEEGNFLNHFFPFFQSDWSGIKKKVENNAAGRYNRNNRMGKREEFETNEIWTRKEIGRDGEKESDIYIFFFLIYVCVMSVNICFATWGSFGLFVFERGMLFCLFSFLSSFFSANVNKWRGMEVENERKVEKRASQQKNSLKKNRKMKLNYKRHISFYRGTKWERVNITPSAEAKDKSKRKK